MTAVEAIGVVGAGAVGQAVATALGSSVLCRELLVVSRIQEQAAALADDLEDMRCATGSALRSRAGTTADLHGCQAVIVAARASFTNTRRADVRMGGAQANAPVIAALGESLQGYAGTVLVVTNPVDLMTRLLAEVSGCARVFGIGSNLDSARYRAALGAMLEVEPGAVRGHVIGEHGDTAVVCASTTTVHGQPARIPLARVRVELAQRPGRISARLGRTRCGPAGAVVSTLRKALALREGTEELCAPYCGGWLGVPLYFANGNPILALPCLDAQERRQLTEADAKLRAHYHRLCESTSLTPARVEGDS